MKLNRELHRLVQKSASACFDTKGQLDESQVNKLVKIFSSLPKLQAIETLSLFDKILKLELKKRTLTLESPIELSKNQIDAAKKALEKEYPIAKVETKLNSSLFGGLKVTIGDVVLDDSLASRIDQVKQAIKGH